MEFDADQPLEDEEIVDAVIVAHVVASSHESGPAGSSITPATASPLPAARSKPVVVAQAAAVAVTSFAAGAATLAVVNHRRGRRVSAKPARRTPAARAPQVVASQRFIVDVHQLG